MKNDQFVNNSIVIKKRNKGAINTSKKFKVTTDTLFNIIIVAIISIISVSLLYPFIYVISVSLSNYKLAAEVTFYPKGLTFDAYGYIFSLKNVQSGYLNTLKYTFTGVFINMIMTILCAYPLSKKWLPGRTAVNIFILVTMYFSGGLIPLYLLVDALGMRNTMWSLVVPAAISTWNMIIVRTYFLNNIPSEIEESCYIDGANELRLLVNIYLPLSKPILATISLFYFIGHWNSWFMPSIFLDDSSKYPIQLVLRNVMVTSGSSFLGQSQAAELGKFMKNQEIDVNSLNNALTIAVVLPIIFIYPFCQKYFIKGVMIGSLKG